jgi:hypothetical protein
MTQPSQTSPPEPPEGVREMALLTASQHLVDVNKVAELWSLPPSAILAMVDCAQIHWAWDVSVQQGRERCVRVWFRELFAPHLVRAMSAAGVIAAVLGHPTERRLLAQTVSRILMVSDKTVQDLVAAGELSGAVEDSGLWVTRASLAEFLSRRIIV